MPGFIKKKSHEIHKEMAKGILLMSALFQSLQSDYTLFSTKR